jgi:hypothetical protein
VRDGGHRDAGRAGHVANADPLRLHAAALSTTWSIAETC